MSILLLNLFDVRIFLMFFYMFSFDLIRTVIFSDLYKKILNSFIIDMDIQPEEYVDQFSVLRMIGEGGQANVYLGTKEGKTFALKIYSSGVVKETAYKIEVELLAKIDHPHIIRIVDHRPQAKLRLQHRNQERRPLVVLELAEGGELFDYISKTGKFSPDIARTYIKQLISAVEYLSLNGITHRDLKPQNILFDSKFNLKVSDFGLARNAAGKNGDGKLKSRVGTQGYKAPQIQEQDYDGTKVDVFAIGVILFIMYTGSPPFLSTKSHDRIYRLIREKKYQKFWELHQKNKTPNFYSESFKRLINRMISAEPDRRPSFEELQDDQWLRETVLTPPQLQNEMLSRANQIGIKIAQKPKINEYTEKNGYRKDIDLNSKETTKQQVLSYHYHHCEVESLNLIELQKKGVVYSTKDPKLVFSMINAFLFQQQKENKSFLQNFVQEITFIRYSFEYTTKNAQLFLTLCFQIQKEDQIELVLLGNMYKNKCGEIGIQWSKKQGNSYWLASIEAQLTKCLSSL